MRQLLDEAIKAEIMLKARVPKKSTIHKRHVAKAKAKVINSKAGKETGVVKELKAR